MNKKYLSASLLALSLVSQSLSSDEFDPAREKQSKEQVSYNLLIHNYTEAVNQASQGVKDFPLSQSMRELYIESLAKVGDEKRLLQSWQKYARDFSFDKYKDSVLENLAWGVIQKAHISDNLTTRFMSLIAASVQNDTYSVDTLKSTLNDSNALLREVSLHFCLNFGDEKLKDEVLRLLEHEQVFEVRKKVIEVAQRLKIKEARPILEKLLQKEEVSYQERSLIVSALMGYYNEVNPEELERLSQSSDLGHRLLVCGLYQHFDLKDQLHHLKKLVYDSNKQVRLAALSTLGLHQVEKIDGESLEEILASALEDSSTQISLLANWALLKCNPTKAKASLRSFLLHTDQNVRLQAAGLIGYSLPLTESLAQDFYDMHPDPYVRANLSFFLAAHRIHIEEACDQLYALFQAKEVYMFKEVYPAGLRILAPSQLVLGEGNPEQFYAASSLYSQMAQLEILNLLAVLNDPRASEAMALFLENHQSDVTTLSLRTLFQLEDTQALELMKDFLGHQDKHKRLEAALVLAIFKRDEDALKVLEDTYTDVSRDLKQIILMAIGEIASKESIPFLMDRVYESSQTLRINAAAALIQCLRH